MKTKALIGELYQTREREWRVVLGRARCGRIIYCTKSSNNNLGYETCGMIGEPRFVRQSTRIARLPDIVMNELLDKFGAFIMVYENTW